MTFVKTVLHFMNAAEILTALNWRYATKVFDPAKKIPAETWAALEESLILTPSSYGLQPWKFLIVQEAELREQLVAHSWRQRQVADCSHLVVMAVKKAYSLDDLDAFITRMAEVRGGTAEALAGFRKMVAGTQAQGYMTKEWAKMQAYIALGQFMTSCALLGIDTCPMEGFVPAKYDELLGLEAQGLTTAVLCPAGYRHADDRYASLPKVRFTNADVIEHR
jgi:nitroreductase